MFSRVNIIFSFQYCGQKDGLRSVKDVSDYINTIEATFDIAGICDPEQNKFKGSMFIQDMALVIRQVDQYVVIFRVKANRSLQPKTQRQKSNDYLLVSSIAALA